MTGLLLFCECLIEKVSLESLLFHKKVSKSLNSIDKESAFTVSLSGLL